ncbi:hypothetical protein [Rhizobium laguerreae]|uniref:hypothetical protein n=1 Tax=Rhizobium laguerreae TaxID=1076926 RepID=UPI001C9177B1|nr:hypothetical protein [Rhizobium laguerreae]MBY3363424.1 hypothetical protein [Rhizobium laguerreae]
MLYRYLRRLSKLARRWSLPTLLPIDKQHRVPQGTRFFAEKEAHVFFGYYDIDPISPDGTKLLACRLKEGSVLEIGYFELDNPTRAYRAIGTTIAWNWQQGCRARWGGPGHGSTIVFNGYLNDRLCAISHDVETGDAKAISTVPLYAIDETFRFGLTLDFGRLFRFRPGYGYSSVAEQRFPDDTAPRGEGVWLVDLSTQAKKLVVSLKELADFYGKDDEALCHYVNHLDFVPNSTRIQMFHIVSQEGAKGVVRLITADRGGGNLCSIASDLRASHYTWTDDRRVLVTGLAPDKRCHFDIFDEGTGAKIAALGDIFTEDGHPSAVTNCGWISDTYPDKSQRQHLYYANTRDRQRKTVASFHSPGEYRGDERCDLHPRYSRQKRAIVVDCIVNGYRAMAVIPFDAENAAEGSR